MNPEFMTRDPYFSFSKPSSLPDISPNISVSIDLQCDTNDNKKLISAVGVFSYVGF